MNTNRLIFRVYDKDDKKYIDESEVELMIRSDGVLLFGNFKDEVYFPKHKCEIEQCTGIHDKHGKLIFEGDFIWDGEFEGVVVWKDSCWQVRFTLYDGDEGYEDLEQHFSECCEIHGNIHDGR